MPAQIAEVGVITTDAGCVVTLIFKVFDVAGLPKAQLEMLDVSTQVTASRSFNVLVVYVVLLVPTGVAPTYHW